MNSVKRLSRIVWSEGMYLAPHHFQAQSGYFEDAIHFAVSALWPYAFGFSGYELDAEALRNGTVSLLNARGIFPDGLPFHMPDYDPLPPARQVGDLFPPTRDRLNVLLAVPVHKATGANCAPTQGEACDGARYIAEERYLCDENTGQDEKPVRLGRKNIGLILDTEASDHLLALGLARILRSGAGQYIYDEKFIPPCLQISASGRLMAMTRRLIEILNEKNSTLSAGGRGRLKLTAGMSPQQVDFFWFLHAINAALAPLRHLCFSRQGHPEQLYMELMRLAGALCTFGLESHPSALPLYNHLNLEECFEALDDHIRAHLEMFAPTNCISITLRPVGKYIYEGAVTDARCLGRSRWILGINSSIGEATLISSTPQLVKFCSARFVPELVKRAVPGMTLTHLPVPPSAISPKVESQYFALSKSGPCWDHIVETKQVGIYVPGEIPNPEIELLVVLES